MNKKADPSYRLYAAILAAIVVIRIGDLATQQAEWTIWVYQSTLCRALLVVAAVATSCATAVYMQSRVSKVTALLICGMTGSATMLLTNSSVGMVIGLAVGAGYLFTWSQRACGSVARFLINSIVGLLTNFWPGMALACATGIVSWLVYIVMIPTSRGTAHFTFCTTILIGLITWISVQRRSQATKRWYGWLASGMVFAVCLVVSLSLAVFVDSARRRMAVAGRIDMEGERVIFTQLPNIVRTIRSGQLPPAALLSALLQSIQIDIGSSSTDEDVKYIQGIAFPLRLNISSTKVSEDALSKLALRQLISFSCNSETLVSDETLKRLENSKNMTSINVSGPRFTDAGLSVLRGFSRLQVLSMPHTKVTARGLANLNRKAPLVFLNLSDTQVGDDIFLVLADFLSIGYVNLHGTPITGRGLKHLRKVTLGHLDLSDTQLEERFLKDLLQPMPSGTGQVSGADLESISLDGVRLSPNGVKTLARMRWLTALSIPDAQLDEASLQAVAELKFLEQLCIPAQLLTPEALSSFAPISELTLAYDANQMPLEEIGGRFLSLSEAHQQRMQHAGVAANPNISLLIRNLVIDEAEARQLLNLSHRVYQLQLKSAEIVGQETKGPVTIDTIRNDFPHLLKVELDRTGTEPY